MPEPTVPQILKLLDYNPDTGDLTWNFREDVRPAWNARYAGQRAGVIDRKGYSMVRVAGLSYPAHRIAWLIIHGDWPSVQIDHVNGDKSDNRLVNLRAATLSQNMCNRKLQRNNTSGFKGVHWDKREGKWKAAIGWNNQKFDLGFFRTPEAAHKAYQEAARQLHGDFANFGAGVDSSEAPDLGNVI